VSSQLGLFKELDCVRCACIFTVFVINYLLPVLCYAVLLTGSCSVRSDLLIVGTNSHETDYAVDPPQVVKATCQFLEQYIRGQGSSKGLNVSRVEELKRLYPCSQVNFITVQHAACISFVCQWRRIMSHADGQLCEAVRAYSSCSCMEDKTDGLMEMIVLLYDLFNRTCAAGSPSACSRYML